MPTTTVERVDRLESVFASFMEKTEEALADIRASTAEIRASTAEIRASTAEICASTAEIRASTAEIRASNLRTDAVLLEMQWQAKRRLNPETIREFVERAEAVPEFMTEYAGHKLVLVVASVTIHPSVITFLNRQKVYGVAMGGPYHDV